jgi:NADPH-dependent 2,4-dienoyl-CoA reductase/sulfur reductase-like enzyme
MNHASKRTITEPAREIPLLMETDIVVVGGGTTGPLAAISAARRGKRVVMIERFGSLGGNLTLGLNTKPSRRAGRGAAAGDLEPGPLGGWGRAGLHGGGQDGVA